MNYSSETLLISAPATSITVGIAVEVGTTELRNPLFVDGDSVVIHSAGILAGAYAARSPAKLLTHAVSDTAFVVGRLARDAGEALCVRTLDTVDPGGWDMTEINCPKCLVILNRLAW